jgi:hypothetical protein
MAKAKLDLTERLHKIEHRNVKRLAIALSIPILIVGSSWVIYSLLPWSFQLFIRWVFRQGDLYQIPEKFHEELNDMCRNALANNGIIEGRKYLKNIEIADSLGTFRCTLVNGGQEWLIQDHKSFNSPDEAILGTELAVSIASILGTDYSYDIEAKIPNLNLKALPIPIIDPKPRSKKTPAN